MSLQAHTITPAAGSHKKKKRVGRGNSSGRGTYSSRGAKGQRARSGGKSGLKYRGLKQALQKIPKVRGFQSQYPKAQMVTLATLERVAMDGQEITPRILKLKKAIRRGNAPVKIVGSGVLSKKLILSGCAVSASARKAIESAGGMVGE